MVEEPFPSAFSGDAARFDLAFVALGKLGTDSVELFGVDFGAVVFAITLFLCGLIFD
ncbi:MAG: hypothetical protein WA431_01470 [Candidatus Cybelea sp.]